MPWSWTENSPGDDGDAEFTLTSLGGTNATLAGGTSWHGLVGIFSCLQKTVCCHYHHSIALFSLDRNIPPTIKEYKSIFNSSAMRTR